MTTSSAPPAAALRDIDWVEIPGGDYIYQDGTSRTLPTFYMARHLSGMPRRHDGERKRR